MLCSTVLDDAAVSISPSPTKYSAGSASHSVFENENAHSAAPASVTVQPIRRKSPRIPVRSARYTIR
jgi:hypothetical protein